MPTKLPKPITITFTHVENAIMTALKAKNQYDKEYWNESNPRHGKIRVSRFIGEVYPQIYSALEAQGIDLNTWEPPQPFKIGSHEVEFKPNGGIKVGCTDVDRATLEKVMAESNKAMGKVEPEWPRYYKGRAIVFRVDSKTHYGTYIYSDRATEESSSLPYGIDWAQEQGMPQITRAEACTILGRDV